MAAALEEERRFIERVTGYRFRSVDLLQEALIAFYHKRMALVGDAVLKIAILDDWYGEGTTIGKSCLRYRLMDTILASPLAIVLWNCDPARSQGISDISQKRVTNCSRNWQKMRLCRPGLDKLT